MNQYRSILATLLLGSMLQSASAEEYFSVYIDTGAVVGQSGAVQFVLTSPRGSGNAFYVLDFDYSPEATVGGPVAGVGEVAGDLVDGLRPAPGTRIQTRADEFYAELEIPFAQFGNWISFKIQMATWDRSADGNLPDQLAFYVLDSEGNALVSSDDPLGANSTFAVPIIGDISNAPEVFSPATFSPAVCPRVDWGAVELIIPYCTHGAMDDGQSCNDGNVCNGIDSCSAGSCSVHSGPAAAGVACRSDLRPCTKDECDGIGDCAHVPGNEGAICSPRNGICDVPESCTGSTACCPTDTFVSSGVICRSSSGICDEPDTCTGTSGECPDILHSLATVCRAAAGSCDREERCTGDSVECPADAFEPWFRGCRAAVGVCDDDEYCTGVSASCPADVLSPAAKICRTSSGACDVAETCTGATADCPPDVLAGTGTICHPSAGICDDDEYCTGTSASCPAGVLSPSAKICRASSGACDVTENCTGATADCPPDVLAGTGTICRPSAGPCDAAERCTGASSSCPADVLGPSARICRASGGACDVAENCTGATADCPPDVLAGTGTICRPSAGICDVPESCTGASTTCPADVLAASTTVCRAAAGVCDLPEFCSGFSVGCSSDVLVSSDTVCRDSEDLCDFVEFCSGANAACPSNAFASSATPCPTCPTVPLPDSFCGDLLGGTLQFTSFLDAPAKKRFSFRSSAGEAVTRDKLGDPVSGDTGYALCLYGNSGLIWSRTIESEEPQSLCGDRPCWSQNATQIRYHGLAPRPGDGLSRMELRARDGGLQTKINGRGQDLPIPFSDLAVLQGQEWLLFQIVGTQVPGTHCWESFLEPAAGNDARRYKAEGVE